MPDLEEVYRDAMAALPTSPDYDAAEEAGTQETARRTYAHGSLPLPAPGLASGRIIVHGGTHSYPSLSVDFIQVHAHRETYRALGLFIFAGLLAPGPRRFELALTHPASQVRRIVLDTSYRESYWAGLLTEPREIAYLPAARKRHPLGDVQAAPRDLPAVSLTDHDGFADRDWPGDPVRDTLIGFDSDLGAYLMGELLLNVSQEWSGTEYTLEGPYGFGGVAPWSAEIRFWLPGADGWDDPSAALPASA
jgi:hypothetical protein